MCLRLCHLIPAAAMVRCCSNHICTLVNAGPHVLKGMVNAAEVIFGCKLSRGFNRRPEQLLTAGFPYPISLTMWHMFFCSALAFGLVRPSFRS